MCVSLVCKRTRCVCCVCVLVSALSLRFLRLRVVYELCLSRESLPPLFPDPVSRGERDQWPEAVVVITTHDKHWTDSSPTACSLRSLMSCIRCTLIPFVIAV